MRLFAALLIARIARVATRLRGGGSAFPGWILLRLIPDVLLRTLGALPRGVVFVTGSNGKSTTTTMLASVLTEHGLRVFSNPAGGNLPQGLASAVVANCGLSGRVRADVAVLEVDEAYGPHISQLLRPDWVIITNLQVDQLNRFGEPENVYRMMKTLALRASRGVVVNQADPNLLALAHELSSEGIAVRAIDVSDEAKASQAHGLVPAPLFFDTVFTPDSDPIARLTSTEASRARIEFAGHSVDVALPADGLHYAVDAALAVGAASWLLGTNLLHGTVSAAFEHAQPVFGRGETIVYRGRDIALTMMKNLPSLQVNLAALRSRLEIVWIAVDEGTPDPSWIFDTDLGPLDHVDVLSGTKAWQWAIFLDYRGISYGQIISDTATALDEVVRLAHTTEQPVHAIVNYEQMMLIRRIAGYKELEGQR
jgi:lipid II isoglutaminyl synthase (glutamine-hydrolysing)